MIMKSHNCCLKFINFTKILETVALLVIYDFICEIEASKIAIDTKNLKTSQPLQIEVIRCGVHKKSNDSAVWNLDSTHELVT